VVEEAGVPGENQRPWVGNWYTLSLAAASRVHPFCNSQSRATTHAVLVIGLYELLGNPTTYVVEWSRALDVRLSEWCCSVSMVWVQIPSREEQNIDSSKI
jgi:hypothetical protein